jgi:hypothetical protein
MLHHQRRCCGTQILSSWMATPPAASAPCCLLWLETSWVSLLDHEAAASHGQHDGDEVTHVGMATHAYLQQVCLLLDTACHMTRCMHPPDQESQTRASPGRKLRSAMQALAA